MGCVSSPHKVGNVAGLVGQYDRVQALRTKLLEYIFASTLPEKEGATDGLLRETALFKGSKADLMYRINTVKEQLGKLKDTREISSTDEKAAVQELRKCGQILGTYGALVNEPDVSAAFGEMRRLITERAAAAEHSEPVRKVLKEVFPGLFPEEKAAAADAAAPAAAAAQ